MELKKNWVELVAIIFYIKAIPILYSKIKKTRQKSTKLFNINKHKNKKAR